MVKNGTEPTLQDVRPINSARYHAGPKAPEYQKIDIDEILPMNVIELAQSGWALPIVIDPKNDGSLRFCTEYIKLNTVAAKKAFPIH